MVGSNGRPYLLPFRVREGQKFQPCVHSAGFFVLLLTFYLILNATVARTCVTGCPRGAQFEVKAKRHEILPQSSQTPTPTLSKSSQLNNDESAVPSFMALTPKLTVPAVKLGGFPVQSDRGLADLNYLCLKHRCGVASKVIQSGSCQAGFKCESCELTGAQNQMNTPSHMCEALQPASTDTLILGIAYSMSSQTLNGNRDPKKRESTLLNFYWDDSIGPVDIGECIVEDLSIRKQQQVLQDTVPVASLTPSVLREFFSIPAEGRVPMLPPRRRSSVPLLHARVVFAFTITNLADFDETSLTITIRFNPPNKYTTDNQKYVGGGQCTHMSSTLPTKSSVLKPSELVTMVHSVSVPHDDKDSIITRDDFEVELRCDQKSACPLAKYRICARILCTKRPQMQRVVLNKLKTFAVNSEKNPQIVQEIPAIPEYLQDEYNLLKTEQAVEAHKESLERKQAMSGAQMEAQAARQNILSRRHQAEEDSQKMNAPQVEAVAQLEFNPQQPQVSNHPIAYPATVEYRQPITVMANRYTQFPKLTPLAIS